MVVLLLLLTFCLLSIVGVCNCSMFCCMLLYVHCSIAIILMGKRELVALFNLSSCCLVMVERLFLAVSWGCLRFVIVVFPDHTHLLFLVFLCSTSTKQGLMCLAQGHKAVTLVRQPLGLESTILPLSHCPPVSMVLTTNIRSNIYGVN